MKTPFTRHLHFERDMRFAIAHMHMHSIINLKDLKRSYAFMIDDVPVRNVHAHSLSSVSAPRACKGSGNFYSRSRKRHFNLKPKERRLSISQQLELLKVPYQCSYRSKHKIPHSLCRTVYKFRVILHADMCFMIV